MAVVVRTDSRNLKRRLNTIQKKLDAGAKLSVQETGRWTRDKIIQFMPKATGESAKSIIYRVEKMTPQIKEIVVTQGFKPHPTKTWNGAWFNLPRWMFSSPNAIGHFREGNGNIMTMRTVPDTARIKFGYEVRNKIRDL